MKYLFKYLVVWGMLVVPAIAFSALDGGSQSVAEPDGIFSVTPVEDRTCIAVQVSLEADRALAGIRWYNNDGQLAFPKVLVASGLENVPPFFEDGIVVADDQFGEESAWSELIFTEPIGSLTDALYVIFQLPANSEATGESNGPGIGYLETDDAAGVFLSSDGDDWVRLKTDFGLMIEPQLVAKEAGVLSLYSAHRVEEDTEVQALPTATQIGSVYPNPFNPKVTIEYSVKDQGMVSVQVYDIMGRHIDTLMNRRQDAGHFVVEWKGTNRSGARVASGVYFVKMNTDTAKSSKRIVMIK